MSGALTPDRSDLTCLPSSSDVTRPGWLAPRVARPTRRTYSTPSRGKSKRITCPTCGHVATWPSCACGGHEVATRCTRDAHRAPHAVHVQRPSRCTRSAHACTCTGTCTGTCARRRPAGSPSRVRHDQCTRAAAAEGSRLPPPPRPPPAVRVRARVRVIGFGSG